MTGGSILLIGVPDSGKTNFLARLWAALRQRKGALAAPDTFGDIKYVEDSLAHLLMGHFAPRSDKGTGSEDQALRVPFISRANGSSEAGSIVVPDVSGELWKNAVETCELPPRWMEELEDAIGVFLFVRVGSNQNVAPLDWVTSARMLRTPFFSSDDGGPLTAGEGAPAERTIPTQVTLCELLRFVEHAAMANGRAEMPRLAVLVTAWDMVDAERRALGPSAYLSAEYPLFAGRLVDTGIESKVFGVSVVGGDFVDSQFQESFFAGSLDEAGYVVVDGASGIEAVKDMTLPAAWVLRRSEADDGL